MPLLCSLPIGVASANSSGALYIREVKITGDEFVVLQAAQDVDLSDYWLGYSSSDTAQNIVPTQQLPSQVLKAGQALLLTSDGTTTCDATLTTRLSPSLSDTKGTLVLRQLQSSDDSSTFTTIDSVNWNKPSSTGSTTDKLDLRQEAGLNYPVWFHDPAAASWRVGNLDNCSLTLAPVGGAASLASPGTVTWQQNDTDPPAIIESTVVIQQAAGRTAAVPASDIGLLPPQITELLPNPAGTGTDGTDEFVELYNPNQVAFDLSGFVLQTGGATKHNYTFPAGTSLAPKSFKAFYSVDTGLSLSNSSGQADLLDPLGTQLAATGTYGTAKDGQAWALAKGKWYWTSKPTPNSPNDISQAVLAGAVKKSSKSSKTGRSSAAHTASAQGGTAASASPAATTPNAPIHPGVLAAVALLAVGYMVYEFRHDLANRIHQFRTHRTARRAARQ